MNIKDSAEIVGREAKETVRHAGKTARALLGEIRVQYFLHDLRSLERTGLRVDFHEDSGKHFIGRA
jgi:hypothetical protein